jgi:hypothetical protein
MAHTWDHSYSGGRDQEDHLWSKWFVRPYLKKNLSHKRAGSDLSSISWLQAPILPKKKKKKKERTYQQVSPII